MTNADGRRIRSIAFFKDSNIAKAFAQNQTDANYHKTRGVIALTDGKVGYLLEKEVELSDDEKAKAEIISKALEKLFLEEKRALGL